MGTRAQTILERNATSYSVFSRQSLPPPSNPNASTLSALQPFFDIANNVVSSRSKNQTGPQPFLPQDASAADPASLGVCILIANWTREANGGASKGLDYAGAAKSQIDYLFSAVPRTSDGALSHRVSELQLWFASFHYLWRILPFCLGVTLYIWSHHFWLIMVWRLAIGQWSARRTIRLNSTGIICGILIRVCGNTFNHLGEREMIQGFGLLVCLPPAANWPPSK